MDRGGGGVEQEEKEEAGQEGRRHGCCSVHGIHYERGPQTPDVANHLNVDTAVPLHVYTLTDFVILTEYISVNSIF